MITPKTRAWPLLILLLMVAGGALAQGPEFSTADPEDPTPAAVARYWSGVTVTDVDGWDYRGATIRWIDAGDFLEIVRADGAARRFAPSRIARIHDAQGRDITAEVAAARHDGQADLPSLPMPPGAVDSAGVKGPAYDEIGQSRPIPGASLADLAAPQLFAFAFDAGIGYATTTGAWFTGLEAGFNYQLGLRAMVGPRNWIHFVYRHQDLGEFAVVYDIDLSPTSFEFSLNEYQFLFGRHARLVENKAVRSVGYLEFGLSVMEHRVHETAFDQSDSETKMGLAMQGGVLAYLTPAVAIDLSASATWKAGSSDNEGAGFLFGIHAGFVLMF